MRITGHAPSDEHSPDGKRVCAAVSALEDTFEASAVLLGKSSNRASKGPGYFEWVGLERESDAVKLLAASFVLGCERISQAHPEWLVIQSNTTSLF